MLYFIPAWYKEKEWCEDEQSWRVKRAHSEFDDTVKQIQLFHRSGAGGIPCPVLVLFRCHTGDSAQKGQGMVLP